MDGQFQALIDAIDVVSDKRNFVKVLKNFAVGTGFERFAYLQIAATEITTFNNYPADWQDIYLAKQYSRVDPVVTQAKRTMKMFDWSLDGGPLWRLPVEQKTFHAEAIDFGIRSGVSIPVEGSFGTVLMLTLASSQARVDLSALGGAQRAAHAVLCMHYRLRAASERIFSGPKPALSPKELVSLKWAANGKYMPEIAVLTNTRYRTVQHYLDNARTKLGATNLTHAVSIAKDCGLIDPD